MTLIELYTHFGCSWRTVVRRLGLSVNSYQYWIKRGSIPYRTQTMIERKTNGELVSDVSHDIRTKRISRNLNRVQSTKEN